MARQVILVPAALEGLRTARRWLTQAGSGPAGRRRWEQVRNAPNQLADWPYAGQESPDHPGCRRLIVEGYCIIYEVGNDTGDRETAGDVTVLAVFPPGVGDRTLP